MKEYNSEIDRKRVTENKSKTDIELLKILKEKGYLEEDEQEYILSSPDINELYSALDDVYSILEKKKNKRINKTKFLSDEDEDILNDFLHTLVEEVENLNGNISKAISKILEN